MPTMATKEQSDSQQSCQFCGHNVALDQTVCPHCAQPSLYPNVRVAETVEEIGALERRFSDAIEDAEARGCKAQVEAFAEACATTRAVMNYPIDKLGRTASAGTEIFERYCDLERLRIRSEKPAGIDWESIRYHAEIELMKTPRYCGQLHYASLSFTDLGLAHYGECSLTLREEMISHRSSCFETNTGVLWKDRKAFDTGKRSSWENRNKLCTAKLSPQITAETRQEQFPFLLTRKGATSLDDDFVEVQVFGSITRRTIQSVAVPRRATKGQRQFWKIIRKKLETAGVQVNES